MAQVRVTLPAHATAQDLRVVLKYFENSGRLSP